MKNKLIILILVIILLFNFSICSFANDFDDEPTNLDTFELSDKTVNAIPVPKMATATISASLIYCYSLLVSMGILTSSNFTSSQFANAAANLKNWLSDNLSDFSTRVSTANSDGHITIDSTLRQALIDWYTYLGGVASNQFKIQTALNSYNTASVTQFLNVNGMSANAYTNALLNAEPTVVTIIPLDSLTVDSDYLYYVAFDGHYYYLRYFYYTYGSAYKYRFSLYESDAYGNIDYDNGLLATIGPLTGSSATYITNAIKYMVLAYDPVSYGNELLLGYSALVSGTATWYWAETDEYVGTLSTSYLNGDNSYAYPVYVANSSTLPTAGNDALAVDGTVTMTTTTDGTVNPYTAPGSTTVDLTTVESKLTTGNGYLQNIRTGITNILTTIGTSATNVINGISDTITDVGEDIQSAITTGFNNLQSGLSELSTTTSNTVSNTLTQTKNFVSGYTAYQVLFSHFLPQTVAMFWWQVFEVVVVCYVFKFILGR